MNLFKRKNTLLQSIAFMALMAAINVVFVLLSTFVPFLLFLLVFLLPLSCTLVVLICPKRFFPIYAFTTVGLCITVSFWNLSDTIFYIIPSLITGFIFALFIERKIPYTWSIITCSFVQFGLSYLLLPLIKIITTVDLLDTFSVMFQIQNYEYVLYVQFFVVFLISFLQEIVSFLFLLFGLKKLSIELNSKHNSVFLLIGLLVNLLLTILFVFVYPPIVYIFLFCSCYFGVFEIIWILQKGKRFNLIILIASFVAFVFAFAGLYQFIYQPFGLLLIEIYLYVVLIIGLINNCLKNNK